MIARVCTSSALNGSSMSRIARLVDEGLRQGDALAHPAGQLVRVAVLEAAQARPGAASRGPARAASVRPAPR